MKQKEKYSRSSNIFREERYFSTRQSGFQVLEFHVYINRQVMNGIIDCRLIVFSGEHLFLLATLAFLEVFCDW